MSDVQGLSVGMTADIAQYLAGIAQLQQQNLALSQTFAAMQAAEHEATQALAEETAALREQAAAQAEASGATQDNGVSVSDLAQGYAAAAKVAKELGDAALAAVGMANELDPSGAAKWNAQVTELTDTFKTLEAHLGSELRPVLESVMGYATEALQFIGRIKFDAIWQNAKEVFGILWDAFKGMLGALLDGAEQLTRFLLKPFEMMRDTALDSFQTILNGIALIMEAAEKVHAIPAGTADSLRDFAKDVKDSFGGSLVDSFKEGAKMGLTALKSGMSGVGDDLSKKYLSDAPMQVAHFKTPKEKSDAEAAEKENAAAQKANADAVAAMHRQDEALALQATMQRAALDVAGAKEAFAEAHNGLDAAKATLEEAYRHGTVEQVAAAQQVAKDALDAEKARGEAYTAAAQKAQAEAEAQATKAREADAAAKDAMVAAQAKADADHVTASIQAATEATKIYDAAHKAELDAAVKAGQARVAAEQAAAQVKKQSDKDSQDAEKARTEYARAHALGSAAGSAAMGQLSGSTRTIADAVQSGIKSGDPMAAVATAAIEIVGKSKGFQDLLGALNTLIDSTGGALGQLFEGLTPLISIITQDLAPVLLSVGDILETVTATVGQALTPLLAGLQPLLEVIGQLLTAFAPLIAVSVQLALMLSLVGPELMLLGELMALLAPLIGYLADGIKFVVDAITGAWNWMVSELQSVLNELAKLPGVGDVFSDLSKSMETWKVHTVQATASVITFTAAVNQATAAARDAADNARLNELDAYTKLADLMALREGAQAHVGDDPNAQALVDEYTREIAAAQRDVNNSTLQAQLAADQLALQNATQAIDNAANGVGSGTVTAKMLSDAQDAQNAVAHDRQALLAAQAEAASATASNTQATDANTAATAAAAASITNMPSGFKLALAEYHAIGTTGGSSGGSPFSPATAPKLSGNQGTVVTGDVHIHIEMAGVATPEKLVDLVDKAMQKLTYRRTGSIAPMMPGGRFALSRLS
jgi:hypothetical protein